jgi:hypothetical protein
VWADAAWRVQQYSSGGKFEMGPPAVVLDKQRAEHVLILKKKKKKVPFLKTIKKNFQHKVDYIEPTNGETKYNTESQQNQSETKVLRSRIYSFKDTYLFGGTGAEAATRLARLASVLILIFNIKKYV